MGRRGHITKWRVLALVVAAGGAVATFGADQLWLHGWARSGRACAIGEEVITHLPAGAMHVYYESADTVPSMNVFLNMWDAAGEHVPVEVPADDNSFRMNLTGWSGRSLWRVDLPEAGTYRILCKNATRLSDRDVPPDDRIVFAKAPDTLEAAMARRKTIQIAGASATIALALIAYGMHLLVTARRGATVEPAMRIEG